MLNIDLSSFIVIISLVFTFFVGIFASYQVSNIRDYALSKGMFSSFSLVCTIVASFVGGGVVIGTAGKAFSSGIGPIIGLLGFPLQLILTGLFIAPRIGNYPDALSIGDILEKSYGSFAKVLAGVLWLCFCIGIIIAQMTALNQTLALFLGTKESFNLLIGPLIVVIYCFLGGIRSVVVTDVVQFLILGIAIPLTLIIGFFHVGGLLPLMNQLPKSHFHVTGLEVSILFLSFLFGDALIPPVVQRLLMAKDGHQAKKTMILGGSLSLPLCIISGFLGLLTLFLKPDLSSNQILPYLFSTILPPFMKGFAIAGVIAVITSSCDSYLNSAAISFVHDIISPIKKSPLTEKNELYLAKMTTLFLGIFAIFFSFSSMNVYDILLQTYKFWGPTMVVPLIFTLLQKPISPKGFYTTVFLAAFSVLLWEGLSLDTITKVSSLIVGLICNLIVYTSFFIKEKKASFAN